VISFFKPLGLMELLVLPVLKPVEVVGVFSFAFQLFLVCKQIFSGTGP
jgi:hypothetical protein